MKKFFFVIALMISGLAVFGQPLVTIDSIQFVSAADLASGTDLSSLDGQTVEVEGVVAFDPCDYGLSTNRKGTWIQTSTTGERFGGVEVLIDPGAIGYSGTLQDLSDDALFIDNFTVGNRVRFTATVNAFSNNTQLQVEPIPSSVVSLGTKPTPTVITVDSLMVGITQNKINGEPWEGTYVEIQNVFVANRLDAGGGRWQWDVTDGLGNFLAIRDASGHIRNDALDDHCPDWLSGTPGVSNTPMTFAPPADGASLAFIRGTVTESFGEYFIAPHDLSDIGPATTSPPIVNNIERDPVIPTSTETVTISADITDADGTIATAELYYAYGLATPSFTMVTMTNTSADRWEANIPGPGVDSTWVKYYFRAVDNAGNETLFPDAMATGSNYICYDDGINSILRIQKNEESFGSIWDGDSLPVLNITATVTAGLQTYDLGLLAVQDDTRPWSGIFVRNSDGIENLFRGDEIRITSGSVDEEFGVTYLENITFDLLSSGNPLPAATTGLNTDSIGANVFLRAEPYEGMLLRFDNATVTSNNADAPSTFGEWLIGTSTTTPDAGMRVDDISNDVPFEFGTDSVTVGETLGFIQGVLYFSFGNYKLLPRNRADIDGFNTTYPNAIVSFRFDGLVPTVNATIDQDANTITAEIPAGEDITTLVPTVDFTGQLLSPESGVANDFTNPVTYTVTAPISGESRDYTVTITQAVGIQELPGLNALQVYPNPTEKLLVVDLDMATDSELTLTNDQTACIGTGFSPVGEKTLDPVKLLFKSPGCSGNRGFWRLDAAVKWSSDAIWGGIRSPVTTIRCPYGR
jgi:hypothetical protein